ncbi:YggS family pyridoxal phosphate-dependent enzyme [Nocardioides aurantiacus]|uniref:YggS family pyridoxal phosphate-dependent enzyme n=1 Tax=Nocardioides aurantiacus TaxID=86796 RepID=UPI00403F244C
MSGDERAADLERRLGEVRERVAAACRAAGRDADEVTLVVVTKFFPASDVRVLADLGVRDVGENRHQEAEAKAEELADLPLRWHFIGGLQSNKAAAVAAYADAVHSLDRAKLVGGLSRGATGRGSDLDVLVQVSLDPPGADGRSGAEPDQVGDLAARVAEADGLVLRGVMGVAPLGGDPGEAFARLAEVAADVRRDHPAASWISAGMSGDLGEAIAHGATHLRIGSAVLGPRPGSK